MNVDGVSVSDVDAGESSPGNLQVTLSVLLVEYRDYFPPNFESDFLRGRKPYFWGPYHWAFFTHLISGPASLMLGAILANDRFRKSVDWILRGEEN